MRERLAPALIAFGLLAAGCDVAPTENQPPDTSSQECHDYSINLGELPGEGMRQGLNKDPIFRASTVRIATPEGHGGGGLFKKPNGELVIRSIAHVTDTIYGWADAGVFIPSYGWWAIDGCQIDSEFIKPVGESILRGTLTDGRPLYDTITEIAIPKTIANTLRHMEENGEIAFLEAGSMNEESPNNIDSIAAIGAFAVIGRADIGSNVVMNFDPLDYEPGDSDFRTISTDTLGNRVKSVCSGMSGQPVLIGGAGPNLERFAIGHISGSLEKLSGPDEVGELPGENRCAELTISVSYTTPTDG